MKQNRRANEINQLVLMCMVSIEYIKDMAQKTGTIT
jgi:hypothetical protein